MNANGTQFETNLVVGLTAPQHIAVGGGNIYWTEASGNVRSASIAGAKTPRTIATGVEIGGIAVGSSKVYWTEKTSNVSGAIRSANHDGTAVANLFTLTAVPKGIAIDGSTLYWTNGWGKIQRRNVDRSKFQDLVTGLMGTGCPRSRWRECRHTDTRAAHATYR